MPGVLEEIYQFREKVLSVRTSDIKYNIMQGDCQQKLNKKLFPLITYFETKTIG